MNKMSITNKNAVAMGPSLGYSQICGVDELEFVEDVRRTDVVVEGIDYNATFAGHFRGILININEDENIFLHLNACNAGGRRNVRTVNEWFERCESSEIEVNFSQMFASRD